MFIRMRETLETSDIRSHVRNEYFYCSAGCAILLTVVVFGIRVVATIVRVISLPLLPTSVAAVSHCFLSSFPSAAAATAAVGFGGSFTKGMCSIPPMNGRSTSGTFTPVSS